MAADPSLLPDLEQAVAHGSPQRRAETLEQVTRLFLHQADALSDEQVALFGEVFERLIAMIETRSLAALSRSLAPVPTAPRNVVRRLAENEEITVAGPMLEKSARLEQEDLAAIARSHGQAHLLAIAGRRDLATEVTDILVQRGDRTVAVSLAGNESAQFSEPGFAALINRASDDTLLAEYVSRRPDLPPPMFHRLVAQAASVVQRRLLAIATPERQIEIQRVLTRVTEDVGGPRERDYTAALARTRAMASAGRLDETAVTAFARVGALEDVIAALSLLCEVPVEIVDRLAASGKSDPILVLCKAARLSPLTVAAVLRAQNGGVNSAVLDQFDQLSPATALRIVHFWRSRSAA